MFKGKKKALVAILLAAVLALGLAACSSGNQSNSNSSQPSESAQKVDPAKDVVGKWQVAAVKMGETTVVGDFAASYDDYNDMSIEVNEGGTGTLNGGEEATKEFTWTAEGDKITFNIEGAAEGSFVEYRDGMIVLGSTGGDDAENPVNEAYFTKDGTYPGLTAISAADAKPVKNEKLAGNYEMCGAGMYAMTVYGEPAAISEAMGVPNSDIVLKDDGTGTLGGDEQIKWKSDDNGTVLIMSMFGEDVEVPFKSVADYYLLDLGDIMGNNMFYLYRAA